MLTNVIYVIVGLIGLGLGGNFLIKGASRLARALGISNLIIGLTVVALGTSAPELIVSLDAAINASSDVALGNVIGSNIANIGLILALAALISPIALKWNLLRREIIVVVMASLLMLVFALDGEISRLDGIVLVASFLAYVGFVYRQGQQERADIEPEISQFEKASSFTAPSRAIIEIGRVIVGLVGLVIGARLLVDGSVSIARAIGVSDLLIGLTLVAVGTSLPELATSFIAAFRKENDIVVGNIVGSNISNIFFILGVVAIVQPIPVSANSQTLDLPVMVGFAALLIPLALRGVLKGVVAVGFLVLYGGYIAISFLR
ncbi:MAG: sodium:calcium antiporter [Phototrophicales bacterium]|nr:MAG: sodium:calcium antiporter [Phototrophicales bacterium]